MAWIIKKEGWIISCVLSINGLEATEETLEFTDFCYKGYKTFVFIRYKEFHDRTPHTDTQIDEMQNYYLQLQSRKACQLGLHRGSHTPEQAISKLDE